MSNKLVIICTGAVVAVAIAIHFDESAFGLILRHAFGGWF